MVYSLQSDRAPFISVAVRMTHVIRQSYAHKLLTGHYKNATASTIYNTSVMFHRPLSNSLDSLQHKKHAITALIPPIRKTMPIESAPPAFAAEPSLASSNGARSSTAAAAAEVTSVTFFEGTVPAAGCPACP